MTETGLQLELDLAAEDLPGGLLDVPALTPERPRHFRIT